MIACVCVLSTMTPTEPATAAVPPPATPMTNARTSSMASAPTITSCSAPTFALLPTVAFVRCFETSTSASGATPTVPPMASEPPIPSLS